MTYDEFKRHVNKAGLSIKQFADLIKHNPASISNHAKNGEIPNNLAIIATLMGELRERRIDFKSTLERIEFLPHKRRGATKGSFGGSRQQAMFNDTEHR